MKEYVLKFIVLLVFVVTIATPTFAQAQTLQTHTLTGQVLKVQNNQVTVQTDKGVQQITVPNNISVTSNGLASSNSTIKPNDRITFTVDQNNQALKADVTSSSVLNGAKWLIPLAAGLVLLGIIALLIKNSMTKEYIKTTTVSGQPTYHDIRHEDDREIEEEA